MSLIRVFSPATPLLRQKTSELSTYLDAPEPIDWELVTENLEYQAVIMQGVLDHLGQLQTQDPSTFFLGRLERMMRPTDSLLQVSDNPSSDLRKELKEQFDQILEKIRDTLESGKVIREDLLEKAKEIRERIKDTKVEIGKKARDLLEKLKEKVKDYWKKLFDILGMHSGLQGCRNDDNSI
ncbi:hypothetical protein FRC10_008453 [Ceratobasidium sp. 414]|nr:hypothetical protein FRC10_008453 [Ceratobasidium sp. 414]